MYSEALCVGIINRINTIGNKIEEKNIQCTILQNMINKKHLTYINHRYVQIIITHLYSLKLIMMSTPKQHNKNRNIQKISQQTSK